MASQIQIRRDTAANWTSANPTLAQGELGIETDTLNIKVGDGSTVWSSLSYAINQTTLANAANAAATNVANTFTAVQTATAFQENQTSVASSGGTTTLDCSTAGTFSTTLSENTTVSITNAPSSGTAYALTLKVIQDASASGYTLAWPASVDWPVGTAPTLSSGANDVDIFVLFTHDGGTTFYGFVAGQDMS